MAGKPVPQENKPRPCPICKKVFTPAIDHYWKIKYGLKIGNVPRSPNEGEYVCSYSCMRVWEKSKGWK